MSSVIFFFFSPFKPWTNTGFSYTSANLQLSLLLFCKYFLHMWKETEARWPTVKKNKKEVTQKKVNFGSEVPTYYHNVFSLHHCWILKEENILDSVHSKCECFGISLLRILCCSLPDVLWWEQASLFGLSPSLRYAFVLCRKCTEPASEFVVSSDQETTSYLS